MSFRLKMSNSQGKIPKIPRIPKKVSDPKAEPIVELNKEFSGEIEGGTLWQVLKVEESLIRKILLQLDPVDLMKLEASCVLLRDSIVQNTVWKYKLGEFTMVSQPIRQILVDWL